MHNKLICFIFLMFLSSCFLNTDGAVENKFLPPLDTVVDYNKIDKLPLFKGCTVFSDKFEQELCTRDSLYLAIAIPLLSHEFSSSVAMNQNVDVRLLVDKQGAISLFKIEPASIEKTLPMLPERLKLIIEDLPTVYPAVKQGQAITVYYTLPIHFKTEF